VGGDNPCHIVPVLGVGVKYWTSRGGGVDVRAKERIHTCSGN